MFGDRASSPIRTILSLLLCLAGLSISAYSFNLAYKSYRSNELRAAPGPASDLPPLGINASLENDDPPIQERKATLAGDAGLRWVRQPFLWREIEPAKGAFSWEKWDRLVEVYNRSGLEVVAVLDRPPTWSRQDNNWANRPPDDAEDFGRFVRAFAAHFRGRVRYLQVWDEPNVFPNWGNRPVDPAGYVELLKTAYQNAKAANPEAKVLSAGLAPNLEAGGRNMSDLRFLDQVYQSGGGRFFDILAAKPYGLWYPPGDGRVDDGLVNFSRVLRHREISVQNGFPDKPVWAVEWGWNSLPEDWKGSPSIWGNLPAEYQAIYTQQAYERAAREWPWLQVLLLQGMLPEQYPNSPLYGFSILDSRLEPRPVYYAVKDLATAPVASAGMHEADSPFVSYTGPWRSDGSIKLGGPGDFVEIRFAGTRLDLLVWKTPASGAVRAAVDGQPSTSAPDVASDGTVSLYAPEPHEVRIVVASGLADGLHTLRLELLPSSKDGNDDRNPELRIGGFVVVRENGDPWGFALAAAWILWTVLVLWGAIKRTLELIRIVRRALARLQTKNERLADLLATVVVLLALGLAYFGSGPAAYVPALIALAVAFYARLEIGLLFVLLLAPTYTRPKAFGTLEFSTVEILIAVCALAYVARWLTDSETRRRALEGLGTGPNLRDLPGQVPLNGRGPKEPKGFQAIPLRLIRITQKLMCNHSNIPIILFVLAGVLSLAVSTVPRESLRELRTVVLEPIIYYYLLVATLRGRRRALDLANVLVLAGVAVAMVGIFQYVLARDVITAEGVVRVRAFYGSPNNLGLFLGRAMPLALSLAWLSGHHRRVYLAALLVMCAALFLTFSIGAWVAVLLSSLFVAAFAGRRAVAWTAASAAAGGVAIVPILQVERISSHLSLQQGTTLFRVYIWQAAVNMLRDHPVLGIGLDNFLYRYPRYMLPEAWREPNLSHPHNLVLDFWLRMGSPGLILILWLIFGFFAVGVRLYRRIGDRASKALAVGVMATMIDFVAHGLIDNSYFLVDLAIIFWAALATLRILDHEGDSL